MIVLDTNVISEMMKALPATKVMHWIDQQQVDQLFITAITIAEVAYGISALSVGKRRDFLEDAFNKTIHEAFQHRILSFDESAAHWYGNIMGQRKKLGKPLSVLDGQIAAIARSQEAAIATRNIRDFADCELDLINPFD